MLKVPRRQRFISAMGIKRNMHTETIWDTEIKTVSYWVKNCHNNYTNWDKKPITRGNNLQLLHQQLISRPICPIYKLRATRSWGWIPRPHTTSISAKPLILSIKQSATSFQTSCRLPLRWPQHRPGMSLTRSCSIRKCMERRRWPEAPTSKVHRN